MRIRDGNLLEPRPAQLGQEHARYHYGGHADRTEHIQGSWPLPVGGVLAVTTSASLAFAGSVLDIELDDAANIGEALEFLSSHFRWSVSEPAADAFARLRVHPEAAGLEIFADAVGEWEDMYVRKSASEFFTIPGRRLRVKAAEFIECTKTGTRFRFDPVSATVDVAVGPSGQLDFAELVRDLVLKDQENRGVLVLHATAAYRDDSVVIITGSKGAGKSTVLLELVENFDYQVVSGDKTLVLPAAHGRPQIIGWPDYPHLGYGTIAKYPGLLDIAGLGADHVPASGHDFSPYGKYAVDPTGFRKRFPSAANGVVAHPTPILHPNIGPGDSTRLTPIEGSRADRAAELAANIESPFSGKHAAWQTFSQDRTAAHALTHERVLLALAEEPAWLLTGPGDLDESNFPPVPHSITPQSS